MRCTPQTAHEKENAMLTIFAVTLITEIVIYAGGEFSKALSRPSRKARLNLN